MQKNGSLNIQKATINSIVFLLTISTPKSTILT